MGALQRYPWACLDHKKGGMAHDAWTDKHLELRSKNVALMGNRTILVILESRLYQLSRSSRRLFEGIN